MAFTVHFVCTGNICRSPMAEFLTRAWADPTAEVVATSSGVRALVGHPIDRDSGAALAQLGIDASGHRARQFLARYIVDADLVLTAERAHRDQVMTEVPRVYKRTFTLKEFVALAPYATGTTGREAVAQASASRSLRGPASLEQDDLADPYLGGISHATATAEQVEQAVQVALRILGFAYAGKP